MMEQEADDAPEGAPEWMVTFADLMSLLLTFFVLLLSFSNMDIVKYRTMAGSVKNALGLRSEMDLSDIPSGRHLLPNMDPKEGDGNDGDAEGKGQTGEDKEQASKTGEQEGKDEADSGQSGTATHMLVTRLRRLIEEAGLEGSADLVLRPTGVSLELQGDLLFDTGKATLRPVALPPLDNIARFMSSTPGAIDIEGHTDNVPIKTSRYPSNWELSAARAGTAVRYLIGKGIEPGRLRAIGHAATIPVSDNDDVQGRQRNRRVAFLFVTDDANLLESLDPRIDGLTRSGP